MDYHSHVHSFTRLLVILITVEFVYYMLATAWWWWQWVISLWDFYLNDVIYFGRSHSSVKCGHHLIVPLIFFNTFVLLVINAINYVDILLMAGASIVRECCSRLTQSNLISFAYFFFLLLTSVRNLTNIVVTSMKFDVVLVDFYWF